MRLHTSMQFMLAVSAASALLAAQAHAADPVEYHLTLSQAEILTIGKALGQQPYSDVAQILTKIQTQVDAEVKAAQAKPTEAEPKVPAAVPESKDATPHGTP